MKNSIKNVDDLKKEYKRMAETCQSLLNCIGIYADFMDNYFKDNWEDCNKEVYKKYKEYSDSITLTLIDYGWVKVNK